MAYVSIKALCIILSFAISSTFPSTHLSRATCRTLKTFPPYSTSLPPKCLMTASSRGTESWPSMPSVASLPGLLAWKGACPMLRSWYQRCWLGLWSTDWGCGSWPMEDGLVKKFWHLWVTWNFLLFFFKFWKKQNFYLFRQTLTNSSQLSASSVWGRYGNSSSSSWSSHQQFSCSTSLSGNWTANPSPSRFLLARDGVTVEVSWEGDLWLEK